MCKWPMHTDVGTQLAANGSTGRHSPAAVAIDGCHGGLLLLLGQPERGKRSGKVRLGGAAQLVSSSGHLRLRQLSQMSKVGGGGASDAMRPHLNSNICAHVCNRADVGLPYNCNLSYNNMHYKVVQRRCCYS